MYSKLIFVSFLLVCLVSASFVDQVTEISIKKQKIKMRNKNRNSKLRYKQLFEKNQLIEEQSDLKTSKIYNEDYVLYSTEVLIGTPAQSFNIQLDTGSSMLWIPGYLCNTTSCKGKAQFLPQNSKSFQNLQQNFTYSYSNFEVLGLMGQDVVSVGGLTIEEYPFGLQYSEQVFNDSLSQETQSFGTYLKNKVREYQTMLFDKNVVSGVVGFSLPTEGNILPIAYYFANKGLMKKEFSIFLSSKTLTGALILGGINSKYAKGPFTYHDVNLSGDLGYWQVNLTAIHINNQTNPYSSNGIVLFDTGNPGLAINTEAYNQIQSVLPTDINMNDEIECETAFKVFPTIKMIIGTSEYEITAKEYVFESSVKNKVPYCTAQVEEMPCINYFLSVGDGFMTKYYTHYDFGNSKLGFALAADL